ncbi:hypothetical protein BH11MYX3_BH11MYX3_05960 [soil metagenome]
MVIQRQVMLLARSLWLVTLLSASTSSVALAGAPCLPKSLFPKDAAPQLDLGLVAGAPVLCAYADYDKGGLTGCKNRGSVAILDGKQLTEKQADQAEGVREGRMGDTGVCGEPASSSS